MYRNDDMTTKSNNYFSIYFFHFTGTISAANSCPASPRRGFHQNQNNYNNYSNNNLQNVSSMLACCIII